MEKLYYPELEDRIKQLTGAPHVIVLGHIARDVTPPSDGLGHQASSGSVQGGAKEVRPATKVNGSVNSAHNDWGVRRENSTKERVVEFLTPGSRRWCLGGLQTCGDPNKSDYLRNVVADKG